MNDKPDKYCVSDCPSLYVTFTQILKYKYRKCRKLCQWVKISHVSIAKAVYFIILNCSIASNVNYHILFHYKGFSMS